MLNYFLVFQKVLYKSDLTSPLLPSIYEVKSSQGKEAICIFKANKSNFLPIIATNKIGPEIIIVSGTNEAKACLWSNHLGQDTPSCA